MKELRVHTQIHSRYQVFDASGQLPFSIAFGLCRRSAADTDPRILLLQVECSVTDVPYALGHGLLTLEQRLEDGKKWVQVDARQLKTIKPKDTEWIALPSKVNKNKNIFEAFTVYQGHLTADDFASILEPGREYRIRLASKDLGVQRWVYINPAELNDKSTKAQASEPAKLVSSKATAGSATFCVVKSLPWPPRVETRLHLTESALLEVSITNLDSSPVTVQMRGHQRYLVPWGPFQPEQDINHHRGPRIIGPELDKAS